MATFSVLFSLKGGRSRKQIKIKGVYDREGIKNLLLQKNVHLSVIAAELS